MRGGGVFRGLFAIVVYTLGAANGAVMGWSV